MRIKPGYGFWRIDNVPVGGDFRRADSVKGEEIEKVLSHWTKPYKGCNATVALKDRKWIAAVDMAHVEQ